MPGSPVIWEVTAEKVKKIDMVRNSTDIRETMIAVKIGRKSVAFYAVDDAESRLKHSDIVSTIVQ